MANAVFVSADGEVIYENPSELRCGSLSAEGFQELAGGVLVDARDHDPSPAYPLLNGDGSGSTGAGSFTLIFGKCPIALDCRRIVTINDRAGA